MFPQASGQDGSTRHVRRPRYQSGICFPRAVVHLDALRNYNLSFSLFCRQLVIVDEARPNRKYFAHSLAVNSVASLTSGAKTVVDERLVLSRQAFGRDPNTYFTGPYVCIVSQVYLQNSPLRATVTYSSSRRPIFPSRHIYANHIAIQLACLQPRPRNTNLGVDRRQRAVVDCP